MLYWCHSKAILILYYRPLLLLYLQAGSRQRAVGNGQRIEFNGWHRSIFYTCLEECSQAREPGHEGSFPFLRRKLSQRSLLYRLHTTSLNRYVLCHFVRGDITFVTGKDAEIMEQLNRPDGRRPGQVFVTGRCVEHQGWYSCRWFRRQSKILPK